MGALLAAVIGGAAFGLVTSFFDRPPKGLPDPLVMVPKGLLLPHLHVSDVAGAVTSWPALADVARYAKSDQRGLWPAYFGFSAGEKPTDPAHAPTRGGLYYGWGDNGIPSVHDPSDAPLWSYDKAAPTPFRLEAAIAGFDPTQKNLAVSSRVLTGSIAGSLVVPTEPYQPVAGGTISSKPIPGLDYSQPIIAVSADPEQHTPELGIHAGSLRLLCFPPVEWSSPAHADAWWRAADCWLWGGEWYFLSGRFAARNGTLGLVRDRRTRGKEDSAVTMCQLFSCFGAEWTLPGPEQWKWYWPMMCTVFNKIGVLGGPFAQISSSGSSFLDRVGMAWKRLGPTGAGMLAGAVTGNAALAAGAFVKGVAHEIQSALDKSGSIAWHDDWEPIVVPSSFVLEHLSTSSVALKDRLA